MKLPNEFDGLEVVNIMSSYLLRRHFRIITFEVLKEVFIGKITTTEDLTKAFGILFERFPDVMEYYISPENMCDKMMKYATFEDPRKILSAEQWEKADLAMVYEDTDNKLNFAHLGENEVKKYAFVEEFMGYERIRTFRFIRPHCVDQTEDSEKPGFHDVFLLKFINEIFEPSFREEIKKYEKPKVLTIRRSGFGNAVPVLSPKKTYCIPIDDAFRRIVTYLFDDVRVFDNVSNLLVFHDILEHIVVFFQSLVMDTTYFVDIVKLEWFFDAIEFYLADNTLEAGPPRRENERMDDLNSCEISSKRLLEVIRKVYPLVEQTVFLESIIDQFPDRIPYSDDLPKVEEFRSYMHIVLGALVISESPDLIKLFHFQGHCSRLFPGCLLQFELKSKKRKTDDFCTPRSLKPSSISEKTKKCEDSENCQKCKNDEGECKNEPDPWATVRRHKETNDKRAEETGQETVPLNEWEVKNGFSEVLATQISKEVKDQSEKKKDGKDGRNRNPMTEIDTTVEDEAQNKEEEGLSVQDSKFPWKKIWEKLQIDFGRKSVKIEKQKEELSSLKFRMFLERTVNENMEKKIKLLEKEVAELKLLVEENAVLKEKLQLQTEGNNENEELRAVIAEKQKIEDEHAKMVEQLEKLQHFHQLAITDYEQNKVTANKRLHDTLELLKTSEEIREQAEKNALNIILSYGEHKKIKKELETNLQIETDEKKRLAKENEDLKKKLANQSGEGLKRVNNKYEQMGRENENLKKKLAKLSEARKKESEQRDKERISMKEKFDKLKEDFSKRLEKNEKRSEEIVNMEKAVAEVTAKYNLEVERNEQLAKKNDELEKKLADQEVEGLKKTTKEQAELAESYDNLLGLYNHLKEANKNTVSNNEKLIAEEKMYKLKIHQLESEIENSKKLDGLVAELESKLKLSENGMAILEVKKEFNKCMDGDLEIEKIGEARRKLNDFENGVAIYEMILKKNIAKIKQSRSTASGEMPKLLDIPEYPKTPKFV